MKGKKLANYQIESQLGAGGMGEVYRAKDLRLGRSVAIKVLPESLATNGERIARFEREAKVLASLNHANIAALHGFETVKDTHFLVMELVEGETLAERIARGPIPADEGLRLAHQIAEALEAAHAKGVVHRDLKPANVKVTPDGRVKVLDFGLAKAMEPSTKADLSNSPTMISAAATNAGMILGTAAYMSPEQARGENTDGRSDIFSFGCVLFEMLTGRQAFQGKTVSDLLASVLAREPEFKLLPRELNPRIPQLLRRALDKDPRQRWQAAGDLRLEIQAIADEGAFAQTESPRARTSVWKIATAAIIAAALAAGITAGALGNRLAPAAVQTVVTRFPINLPEGQRFVATTVISFLDISPDGSKVAYLSNEGLFIRSMSELEPKRVGGFEGTFTRLVGVSPVFSPDGSWIAFLNGTSITDVSLQKVAVTGGVPITLYRGPVPLGVRWDAQGIVFATGSGVMRVSENGGMPKMLIAIQDNEALYGPQVLPDGDHVLFARRPTDTAGARGWDTAQIVVQSIKTGERTTVIEGGTDARYLPTGHIVYMFGGTLFSAPFDLTTLKLKRGVVPVVEGVRRSQVAGAAHYAVSDNGSLVYIPGPVSIDSNATVLAWTDRNGVSTPLGLPAGAYMFPRISPDGKRLAFGIDDGKDAAIWVYDLSGSASMRRLTFGGSNRYPIWSADGQYVAFQSDREGDLGIFRQLADGTGSVERLTHPDKGVLHIPDSWSPDGRSLSFTEVKEGTGSIWIFSLADKKATVFAQAPPAFIGRSVFSPDGRWLAYQSNETKTSEIFVQPFPATGARYQISKGADSHHPLWSPDGKEVFFIPGPERLSSISVTTRPAFSFGDAIPVPRSTVIEGGPASVRAFDIEPSGKRFIGLIPATQPQPVSTVPQIQVVINWFAELQQRAPVDVR